MSKENFTYNFKRLVFGIVIWEIISIILVQITFKTLGYQSFNQGDQLAFKYPELLYFELIAAPFIAILLYNTFKFNANTVGFSKRMRSLMLHPVSTTHLLIRYIFIRIALTCLIVSMAQPFYGSKKVKASIESLELVVALDISNSMNTKDIDKEMSRLEISKRAIIQLINNLHGEKLGLTIFAGSAYIQLPVTSDYNAAKMFVNEVESGMISNQGTNIAAALESSMSMFSKAKTSKAIILVTDGENHEENPEKIFEAIRESEIQLCVLGIGTEQGGLVPNNPNRPELGYKQTAAGIPVQSKLNVKFIQDIADKVNGIGVISSSPFPDLTTLLAKINKLKRTKIDDLEFNVNESKYQYPLFLSLIFWTLYLLWKREYTEKLFNWKK